MSQKTILFQGDSITDCGRERIEKQLPKGAGLGSGYPMLVAARLLCERPQTDWNIVNRGISGHRVVDLYARWKVDALLIRPDILSLLIGVNDTWHEFSGKNGVEVPRYKRIYEELLAWTKNELPSVKFVLMEPFVHEFGAVGAGWMNEIIQRRAVVKELAAKFDAIFIPCQKIMDDALARAAQEYWTRDGVHPSLAGHQLLADAWLKAVSAWL